MNTVSLTQQQADDYRSSMQQAAAAFIERHQAEHLHDDRLYDRTVSYLVHSMGVPVFMADRLVHLAMTERLPKGARWIGIDAASGPDLCILRDHRINKSIPVPARYLPHRFQHHPASQAAR
ncbi:hypothetical protein ACM7HL_12840 [Pseudomonas aeruginosa]